MKHKSWLWVLAALALWLLTGCNQEIEFAFYQEQKWKLESSFTFDPASVPTLGVSVPVVPGLFSVDMASSVMNPALIELSLNQVASIYRQRGFNLTWQKKRSWGGDLTYTIIAEGQGWDRLEALLTGSALTDEPVLPPGSFQIIDLDNGQLRLTAQLWDDPLGLNFLFPTTVRVRGGRIINSNAHEVRGGVATWHGVSGQLDVTLTPVSPFNQVLYLAGGVGAAVALGGGGYFLWKMVGYRGRQPLTPRGRLSPISARKPARPIPARGKPPRTRR
jgi:hypothetical protein